MSNFDHTLDLHLIGTNKRLFKIERHPLLERKGYRYSSNKCSKFNREMYWNDGGEMIHFLL